MISLSKPGSTWLDRLRTSRGFPTGAEPDLDRFLSSGSPHTDSSTHPESSSTQPESSSTHSRNVSSSTHVSDVLSDLFSMGECFSRPKSGRKQANPRYFSPATAKASDNEKIVKKMCFRNVVDLSSSDDLRRSGNDNDHGVGVSSGDNSLNGKKTYGNINGNDDNNGENCEDVGNVGGDGDVGGDMKGYSKVEVTVIDTSFDKWKSDKWVFRKNDEWKIKDKVKGCVGKRKRLLDDHDDDDCENKLKIKKKKKKNRELEELIRGQPQKDKEGEALKKTTDFLGKVPQKRFPCPRPPEKSTIEGPRVVLLKSIPPSNGDVITRLGKSPRKKPPKRMKII